MTNLARLRFLLEHIHNYENCLEILQESYKLFECPEGWFFAQLHRAILALIDHPDTFYGVRDARLSPILEAIALAATHGIAAIELGDKQELQRAGQELESATKPGAPES